MSRPPKKHRSSGRNFKGRRKRSVAQVPKEAVEVTISGLGAQGDGLAKAEIQTRSQNLYIAGALPGETVRAQTVAKRGDGLVAQLLEVITPSTQRVEPNCPYFASCGGCALQHLDPKAYGPWKRERVARVLAQRGFGDVDVFDPILIGEGTRRRVTFSALKRGKHVTFGFNARSSHDLVAIDKCPLLVDGLNTLIAPLNTAMAGILKDGARARVSITGCDNGADVLIEAGAAPGLEAREALAAFVQNTSAVRLGWKEEGLAPEPIAQEVAPLIYLSGVPVE
ncbi:MAG: hypothetical protein JKY27_14410, partial [Magnetovibrio sp.]|nr:hypothetical protein [Magnetovibrio sp.]